MRVCVFVEEWHLRARFLCSFPMGEVISLGYILFRICEYVWREAVQWESLVF